jgi:hypothetical protein
MSFSIRACVVVAILVAGLAVAGCGDTVIDVNKTEDTAQHDLESALHEKITSVSCPSGQVVEPGATFTCTVDFANGKQATETLKILNKDADLKVVSVESKK